MAHPELWERAEPSLFKPSLRRGLVETLGGPRKTAQAVVRFLESCPARQDTALANPWTPMRVQRRITTLQGELKQLCLHTTQNVAWQLALACVMLEIAEFQQTLCGRKRDKRGAYFRGLCVWAALVWCAFAAEPEDLAARHHFAVLFLRAAHMSTLNREHPGRLDTLLDARGDPPGWGDLMDALSRKLISATSPTST